MALPLEVQLTVVDISNDVLGDVNFDANQPWAKMLPTPATTSGASATRAEKQQSSSWSTRLWGWESRGDVQRLARKALQGCCTPQEIYRDGSGNKDETKEEEEEKLVTGILRYIRLPDKYIALCSMLLKSQFAHKALAMAYQTKQTLLPVLNLPRTLHKKPFVPKLTTREEEPDDRFPFSVSHQYPYVALASTLTATCSSSSHQTSSLIGMDIVVFDLPSFYYGQGIHDEEAAVQNFLEAFESSFAPREWGYILQETAPPSLKLREFYLRWSVKEAYTKALGVGMGLEFDSFHVQLEHVDYHGAEGGASHAIWPRVLSHVHQNSGSSVGSIFRSKIQRGLASRHPSSLSSVQTVEDSWEFAFVPLDGQTKEVHVAENGSKSLESTATSCACICGKLCDSNNDGSARLRLTMEQTTLSDLLEWHRNGGKPKSTQE